jgi:hypothetical protein
MRALFLRVSAVLALSCGSGREVILRTAAGVEATAEDIDREPLWLLPPGGIGWAHLEVAPAAASELGKYLLADLRARFPMPEAASFSFERDVTRLSVSTYSMQGVDFAGVATGHFDAQRLEKVAIGPQAGPLAPQLVKSSYAGRSVFTTASIGFTILTPQTALFGNETGIRRCLDRIAESRVADELPAWVKELLLAPNATFSFGVDLQSNPLTAALTGRLAALRGASMARGLGNFDAPGINVAGTIGHADHEAARTTASALLQAGGSLNIYGRLFGLGQPIRKLETQAVGSDTQVVLAVDGGAVRILMEKFLPPPPTVAQHSGQGWADNISADNASPDNASPDNASPDNALPDNASALLPQRAEP